MNDRKDRITQAFADQAMVYDHAAEVQWRISQMLSRQIEASVTKAPLRVLEIGCGTGFLSARLVEAFPDAEFLFTDIAPSMLERCKSRLGGRHAYKVLDGERPDGLTAGYDLIASNLTFQWFVDLEDGMARLTNLLAPGGRMLFSTLGQNTFEQWRDAHSKLNLPCGTPPYPSLANFPWPKNAVTRSLVEDSILQAYADGQDFVRTLKALGASEPAPGHRPLSPGSFRRLLGALAGGFAVTYHVLLGEIRS